jgi:DNA processing protein
VIVEAAEKSSSLITARMVLEQDRQGFAVPGSPLTGRTRGSNRLLKEGARLVDCVEDVLEELAPQLGEVSTRRHEVSVEAEEGKKQETEVMDSPAPVVSDINIVLGYLKDSDRLHVDSIIEGSGLSVQTVLKLLLELELSGLVTQHPGKLFSLI